MNNVLVRDSGTEGIDLRVIDLLCEVKDTITSSQCTSYPAVRTISGLTSLHYFYSSWHLYICRSLFGHWTFFVASRVFIKGTLCCAMRRNFEWNLDSVMAKFYSSKFYMISAVICTSLLGV